MSTDISWSIYWLSVSRYVLTSVKGCTNYTWSHFSFQACAKWFKKRADEEKEKER